MPPDYVFFTSYARRDNEDGLLTRAVEEIRKRVAAKAGGDVEIFFDVEALKDGTDWETRLGGALKDAEMIVCLCSPSYMRSAFCAKEFEIFRLRVDAAGNEQIMAIMPVVWEPAKMPAAISRFHQPKDPRFPSDYYVAGLRQLARLKAQEDNFVTAVEAIADTIDQATQGPSLPPYAKPVRYGDLTNSLHNPEPEPYGIQLTALHALNSQWKTGKRANVWEVVDAIATSLHVGWRDVPAGDQATFADHVAAAEKERLVALMVVDREDAAKAPWMHMLAQLGAGGFHNIAVLVGWKSPELSSPAEITAELQNLVPAKAMADFFPLGDDEKFIDAAKRVITTVRMTMIGEDKTAKVVAPQYRDPAVDAGIPVDTISTLRPPGPTS